MEWMSRERKAKGENEGGEQREREGGRKTDTESKHLKVRQKERGPRRQSKETEALR